MTLFENAYNDVAGLVRKFDAHKDQFLAPKYQEAELRADFLDQFWIALGWDVRHSLQTNPREQEVKIEKSDTAGSTRRVDYAFRLKPDYKNTVFFCEAKKPSVDLANVDDYFQLVRYGYGASTPVGVLTNFDEFHIIDCRYQPHIEKSYPSAQIKVYGYNDYLDKDAFGFIYWLFSREAVAAGKLKEYASGLPKQRGTGKTKLTAEEAKPVDEAFLIKLEEYRRTLAKAFKKADESLNAEALTEATQKVIDRLVFIRFLEDKYIEADYIVDQIAATPSFSRRGTGGGQTAWKSFISWSKELDVKYNGVVFKPHDIDKPTFKAPDDKIFAELCSDISHSHSKYLFTYIPIELLGSIYERFLGKVVTTTAKRADIEEKPEVRKAGGVYYTPKYIVDYIVANTVGKIINPPSFSRRGLGGGRLPETTPTTEPPPGPRLGKAGETEGLTPKEISKLRFADIACGSGSFLIAVYDTVLHHVEKYYNDHPEEAKKAKCNEIEKGIFALTLRQKQQILIDNIFGVDIDRQAVEVAQLSLFLKLLESESGATAEQLSFERTKILPDLSKNIQCGNSLVEYDISDLFPLTPEEEMKIKPFSFQQAFKPIMDAGGFDAVVGNPPYVRQEGLIMLKPYFEAHYKAYQSTADLYTYFIERAVSLLKQDGLFSYIVANKWMRAKYGKPLRAWLPSQGLDEIVDFGDFQVFSGATTYTCILKIRKSEPTEGFWAANLAQADSRLLSERVLANQFKINYSNLAHDGWSLTNETAYEIIRKMESGGPSLAKFINNEIYYGIKTGLNEAFVIDRPTRDSIFLSDPNSSQVIVPFLAGRDIKRYLEPIVDKFLILLPAGWTKEQKMKNAAPWAVLERQFPAIARHLKQFEAAASIRYDMGDYWWELRTCDYYPVFTNPKIIVPAIVQRASYSFSKEVVYSNDKTSIIATDSKYLLGVLNSKLSDFYLHSIASTKQGGFFEYKPMYFSKIPIASASEKLEKSIVQFVDQMLATKKQLAATPRDSEREQLQRKCDYLDGEIDKLVYALYGLNENEIRIVEGNNG